MFTVSMFTPVRLCAASQLPAEPVLPSIQPLGSPHSDSVTKSMAFLMSGHLILPVSPLTRDSFSTVMENLASAIHRRVS